MSDEPKLMRVWITQYALTQGIFEKDVEWREGSSTVARSAPYLTIYRKPDWHLTKAEAVGQAEAMREKKVASLIRSIERLKALTFQCGP